MEKKRKKSIDDDPGSSSPQMTTSQDVFPSLSFEQEMMNQKKALHSKINNSPEKSNHSDTLNDLFEQHYMNMVAEEFEDELDELRKDASFDPQAMPLLVAALKKGVNIFSSEEKQKVLDNLTRKTECKSNNNTS